MTEKILTKAIELANKEFKKCDDLLTLNKDAWNETHDLKMHDARFMDASEFTFELNGATISFKETTIEQEFDNWCEIEYSNFKEWASENGIDLLDLLHYVGRTSQFYIGFLYNEFFSDILAGVSDYGVTMIKLDDKGLIDYDRTMEEYDGDLDSLVDDLLLVTNNMYTDLENALDDIVKVHNYIQNFKKYQCENFFNFVVDGWQANL